MRGWGIQQSCLFCGERNELESISFFACSYTFTVWDKLAGCLCNGSTYPDWSLTLQYVTCNTLRSMDKILIKMVFQTCIYYLWKERNERRHQKGFRSMDQTIRLIDKALRNRISSLRYKEDHKLAGIMQRSFEVFTHTQIIIFCSQCIAFNYQVPICKCLFFSLLINKFHISSKKKTKKRLLKAKRLYLILC